MNAVPLTRNASGHVEPPPLRVEPPADERELGAAREHQHLGPRSVRVHVDRRVREQRHHRPEQDTERERDAGPQVRPPRPHPPHLGADDRLGEQAEPDEEDAGRRRTSGPSQRAAASRASRSESQRSSDEDREQQPDDDHDQRRLSDEPPEPLAARVEQRHPVRLQDRPDNARGARRRPDERDGLDATGDPPGLRRPDRCVQLV